MNEKFSGSLTIANNSPIILPDHISVDLILIYNKNYQPDYSALEDHLLRPQGINESLPFKLIESSKELLSSSDEKFLKEKIHYQLEPLLPGTYEITFLNIPFVSLLNSKEKIEVISHIEPVTVILPQAAQVNLLEEAAPLLKQIDRKPLELNKHIRDDFRQDLSFYYQKNFDSRAVPWQALGMICILILMSIWVWRIAGRKKEALPGPSKSYVALKQAEDNLSLLQSQTFLEKGLVETYIINLTSSLRYFFEEKFNIHLANKTTLEFLTELTNFSIPLGDKSKIEDFLKITDKIKFANYQPTMDECLEAYKIALEIKKTDLY